MTSLPSDGTQSAPAVVMVRPARFAGNQQTAGTNTFQVADSSQDPMQVHAAALVEFDGLVATLRDAGIKVCVFDDPADPDTPDAVFPNNWITFHGDGTVVLYPMLAENRRLERRLDVIDELHDEYGFEVGNIYDLSRYEDSGYFLEGTGSMVLDREQRMAYACLSPRTNPELLGEFARRLNYSVFTFDAFDRKGVPIYHTNVMMCIGTGYVVVCAEAVTDAARREALLQSLQAGGRDIVDISHAQMEQFAGNMLELDNGAGKRFLAMSARAEKSLYDAQREQLEQHVTLLSAPINTIEDHAGGSVRCMLAAVHLPPADDT